MEGWTNDQYLGYTVNCRSAGLHSKTPAQTNKPANKQAKHCRKPASKAELFLL